MKTNGVIDIFLSAKCAVETITLIAKVKENDDRQDLTASLIFSDK